eukprot:CAMPEP_0119263380 /NCGR_PEP_ID=MMETSP1329-20130426/2805_1 /TAXON_ID=114041 /ORGANISM="Genus nov. species nov., Strain RCC1024" /LENGTH=321 /DNA_ID=CAMNT_0007263081 /DNA_START=181 /DNA_END=1146 /DNA_ORIENTATION=-
MIIASAHALAPRWTALGTGPKLSGSASTTTADGRVLLWGGLDENKQAVDTLYAYAHGEWSQVHTTGAAPHKAMYAAAASQTHSGHEEIVVCGGWDPGAKGSGGSFTDAVSVLDLEKLEWISDGVLPCGPVSRHGAATVGDRVFVHTFREDILRRTSNGVIKAHKTTGDSPLGLSMASTVNLGDDRLCVFGGSSRDPAFSRDAYVMDADSYAWTKLDAPGGPGPRGSCASAAVDGERVVVFGGAGVGGDGYNGGAGLTPSDETWLLTAPKDGPATWTLLDAVGPPPRVAASLEKLPDGSFLLTGGWDPKTGGTFDDLWKLEL